MQPLISIITVNFNQLKVTTELLDSVKQLVYPNLEVIVVDNASVEDPTAFINQHYPFCKVIRSETNLGFAGGNNLALPLCTGEYLFYVNNDAEITNGCIENLLERFNANRQLGIISPLLCYYNPTPELTRDIIQYAGSTPVHAITARNRTIGERQIDIGQYKGVHPTAYVHGAAMMIPMEVLRRVGAMADDFFLYYEELDWCERIRKAGYEIEFSGDAKVYHKESLSVGAESPLKTYYLNRNRIYFLRRNRNVWQFSCFVLFLLCFTIPKNTFSYLVKGRTDLLKAFYKAIRWNLPLFKNHKSAYKSGLSSLILQ